MNKIIECEPASKVDELLLKIKSYDPIITRREQDYFEAKFISLHGEELWIEINTEFSIFFGDWHAHYFADEEDYLCFLEDLIGILESKKFTICVYRDGRWCGSELSENELPNESDLKKENGEDKIIKCNYWDKTKNIVFK